MCVQTKLKLFFISILFLFYNFSKAQLEGADGIFGDTNMRHLLKKLNVKSVAGFAKKRDTLVYTGRQTFDTQGNLVEARYANGNKTIYKYGPDNSVERSNYSAQDTVQFYEQTIQSVDSRKTVKETLNRYNYDGTLSTNVIEKKVIYKTKNVTRTKRVFVNDERLIGYTLETDSVSGPYAFNINIERTEAKVPSAKGEAYCNKIVARTYTLNNCIYRDNIISRFINKKEIFTGCFTNYTEVDEKNRPVEMGIMHYSDTIRSLAFAQSQEYNPDVVPPSIIKALYKGALRNKKYKKQDASVSYYEYNSTGDAKGPESFKEGSTAIYNSKNQLIEIDYSGEGKWKTIYGYNDAGLLIKTIVYRYKENKVEAEKECRYTYTFFDK